MITYIDDREALKKEYFLKKIFGKLFGDKGYISQKLFELLFCDGIRLITGIPNKMKNSLMDMKDQIMLRKRSIIETVNDELKNICQTERSRHRCFTNFIVNLLAGLADYNFFPKKPSIKYQPLKPSNCPLFINRTQVISISIVFFQKNYLCVMFMLKANLVSKKLNSANSEVY